MAYIFPIIISGVLSASIALYSWQRRRVPAVRPFIVLTLALAIWSFAYAAELAAPTLSQKITIARVEYFGIVTVPIAWLVFAARFTGNDKWLTPQNLILLAVEPVAAVILVWTSELHGLFWTSVALDSTAPTPLLAPEYGPAFWIHIAFAYVMLAAGSVLLIFAFTQSPALYQGQLATVLVAVGLPWIGNILFVTGLSPLPGLDLTPFGFALSGVAIALGLYRFRFLRLLPVARNEVLEQMQDGVIVLDSENRLVDVNPAALRILSISGDKPIGQTLASLLPEPLTWMGELTDAVEAPETGSITVSGEQRSYQLKISPVYDRMGEHSSRILMLRDVTAFVEAQEALQRRNLTLETLNQLSTAISGTRDVEPILEIAVRLAAEAIDATSACVGDWNEQDGTSTILAEYYSRAATDLERKSDVGVTYNFVEAFDDIETWLLMEEGYYINHVDDPDLSPQEHEHMRQFGAESILGVPMIKEGEPIGYVEVWESRRQRTFTQEDIDLVKAIAREVSVALYDAQLLKELEASAQQYRQLVEQSSDVVFSIDLDGNFTALNEHAEQMTGYPASRLKGNALQRLVHPRWRDEVSAFYRNLREDQSAQRLLQFPIVTGYGRMKWVEQVLTPVKKNGDLVGFQSTARDITERKNAEEAERERRAIAEALRDVAAALNSTLNLDEVLDRILANAGRVVPHDGAEVSLIDETTDEAHVVRGAGDARRGYKEWVQGQRFPVSSLGNYQEMVTTGKPVSISNVNEYPGWKIFPQTKWIRSSVGAPISQKGRVAGFLVLNSTVPGFYTPEHAERLQAFADQVAVALRNASLFSELAERNQELDAFSHTIAHDLKAPLNTIMGYAHLIELEGNIGESDAGALKTIIDTSLRMGEMIDNLLQLAKLRDVTEAVGPVDAGPVAKSAVARFDGAIRERGIAITVAPDMPHVLGHARWLEEIFANLIGNAIKYIGGDNLAPHIHVRGKPFGESVRYEVVDNGLGISLEQQEHLFEMFSRFHREEASGLGLGLSIVQRMVHKMRGEVGVESTPGEGSTFWFTLPPA